MKMKAWFRHHPGISVVCGMFLLIGFCSLTQFLIYTPDSARYLAWANSLAHGEGFIDSSAPEAVRYVVHAPLYPILLAPAAFVFPESVLAAKGMTLFAGCALLLLFYFWMKRIIDRRYALLGSVFLAANSFMIVFSTQILSDVPFALCLVLFFILGEKIAETTHPSFLLRGAFLIVLLAGVFLREIGFTLMAGAVFFLLWNKRYRDAGIIFIATLAVYGVWYLRNEIIVAGAEHPALRNSRVFFMHLYTPAGQSIFAEFGARIWENLSVYIRLIGKQAFVPTYPQYASSLISPGDLFVGLILPVFPVLQGLLIAATLALCILGERVVRKKSNIYALILFFSICYAGVILLYPINDVRFLFPFLLLIISFCSAGVFQIAQWMVRRKFRNAKVLLAAGTLFLLLPDTVWIVNYVNNSRLYRQSPEKYYEGIKADTEYPWQFTKPLHLAGAWISQHSDSSAVVMSRWKELTFWLDGRKCIHAQPQMNPDVFDRFLRDYPVWYIVGAVSIAGLNEYENLLSRSQIYDFIPVTRFANLEIFEVHRKEQKASLTDMSVSPDSGSAASWRQMFRLIETKPKEAERLIRILVAGRRMNAECIYYTAVAKEFALEFDSAKIEFEKIRRMQQAGSFIQQAVFHLDIISHLKQALDTTLPWGQSEEFKKCAAWYWELGYRNQALKMLRQSLEKDPQNVSSTIFYALFSLQSGDTLAARQYIRNAQAVDPAHPFILGIGVLLNYYDSLSRCSDRRCVSVVRMNIARQYISMGLDEYAIDELLYVLRENPVHETALSMLGVLYQKKERFAPAMQIYKRLRAIHPGNAEIEKALADVSLRVYGSMW